MNGYESGTNRRGVSSPDIRALLAASFDDEQEPASAMLARAMIYAQDADRKLSEARSVKVEAERFRAEMQRNTVDQTEALCRQMREEAEHENATARELREESEAVWESARAELERATTLKEESEELRIHALADAEEYRRAAVAESEREAIHIRDEARTQVNAELALRQEQVDEEIRSALASIEKMQAAAQTELEAQQLYTEALRFRAASPDFEDESPAPAPSTRPARRTTPRKPRRT
ncbi:MAG: hypothetical protein O3B65_04250 [Chloroflexi bacterium]|nr:hypothetical protein [Chloroflexota bacterium]